MGAIAYFLLTGQPPFVSTDAMAVMVAHARDPVVPPSRLRERVPDDIEKVVLRCLEKDPRGRFQDARSLAAALASCADAAGWSAEQAEQWWLTHESSVTRQEERADQSSRPAGAISMLTSDETPTLAASAVELNAGPISSEELDLSLSVAEDQTRPERGR
jgi:serine/threonine-protein kinase